MPSKMFVNNSVVECYEPYSHIKDKVKYDRPGGRSSTVLDSD